VHTHFGSATHLLGTVLEVLLGLTFLRFAAYHGARSKNRLVAGVSHALLVQTG